jgi:hypothetical protein
MSQLAASHPGLARRITAFPPELRLLLASSRPAPDPAELESLCRTGIPWEDFLGLARRHGVAAMAAAALSRAGGAVPPWARDQLRAMARQSAARALGHGAELARLNAAFAEAGIDLMALKGPTLSQRLYGSPVLRCSVDLDVLVRLEDLPRAEALMERAGYARTEPGFRLTPRLRAALVECTHHFQYRHPARRIQVELHWGQVFWPPAQVALLWDRRIRLPWLGAPIQELDEDALLVFLCSHGARHAWSRSQWLGDIAAILAAPRRTAWDGLFRLAGALGQELALAQGVLLVRELYRLTLPPPLARFAEAQDAPEWFLCRPLALLQPGTGAASFLGHVRAKAGDLRYQLQLNRRVPLRAQLKALLFHPAETAACDIPDRWFWLHFWLRPLLWLRRRLAAPARLH